MNSKEEYYKDFHYVVYDSGICVCVSGINIGKLAKYLHQDEFRIIMQGKPENFNKIVDYIRNGINRSIIGVKVNENSN